MRYLEHVKSAVLVILIALSILLTFSIWTYTPPYAPLEDTPIVDIAIAEKKRTSDIVKPYRMLVSYSGAAAMKGSLQSTEMDGLMGIMRMWTLDSPQLLTSEAPVEEVDALIRDTNQLVFYYPTEIPIQTFRQIIPFNDQAIPDFSFNHMIVHWENGSGDVELHINFINTVSQRIFRSDVLEADVAEFLNRVEDMDRRLPIFNEIVREDVQSLYVSSVQVPLEEYTFGMEEISPEKFKNALFTNPNLVRSNPVGASSQQYTDDSALMNIDYGPRRISYVHPASETELPGDSATLVMDSIEFVNEHEGWTDDYRLSRINARGQQINFQMHLKGLPVFSDTMATDMTQYWGLDQVYRYIRPYYTLNQSSPFRTTRKQLPSGQFIYDYLATQGTVDMNLVTDIKPGYFIRRDPAQPILTLEPYWYYQVGETWVRIVPELSGGGAIGLE
ncbi:two-component system activity regulator YycH [Chryseomicrobium sp. FSL W7-1435]|uniref:YycH family regulatory protein n=1 Tax=Chryseomicrobium sp. FSL W7-1435 TaxID=2921704 RepID=UPI00315AE3F9